MYANQVRSWENAYAALCDPETASKSTSLYVFLHDEANIETLSSPWKPFPEPSAQEKNKFETKTAPISISPASNSHYSIEEIKEDSLWLSKIVNIGEYAALRLVIEEWQSKPTGQILSGLTEEEAVSVNEAAGFSSLGSSTFVPNSSIITTPAALADAHFDSVEQRRVRLIARYLNTRVLILRTSQLLIAWGASKHLRQSYSQEYRVCDDWLEQLGQDIAAKQNRRESEALSQCISAMDDRVTALDNGFMWEVPEPVQEAVEEKWATAQTTEIIHLLHIALLHADLFTKKFVSTAIVEQWFLTIADKNFFLNFTLVSSLDSHSTSLTDF